MADDAVWTALVTDDRPLALVRPAVALLSQGLPVPMPSLAITAGWPEEKVATTLHHLPRVDWDERGNLIGLVPLSPPRTGSASTGGSCSRGARWTRWRCR